MGGDHVVVVVVVAVVAAVAAAYEVAVGSEGDAAVVASAVVEATSGGAGYPMLRPYSPVAVLLARA